MFERGADVVPRCGWSPEEPKHGHRATAPRIPCHADQLGHELSRTPCRRSSMDQSHLWRGARITQRGLDRRGR